MPQTPEQRREYMRNYMREWSARNPEKVREYQRKRREQNRDDVNAKKRAWRARDGNGERERQRGRELRAERGERARHQHADWTEADRAAMHAAQDGKCYLCGEAMPSASERIDHDHSCCRANTSCATCRRGLAHHRCNILIGMAGDDPAKLRRMADALEAAQQSVLDRLLLRDQLHLHDGVGT